MQVVRELPQLHIWCLAGSTRKKGRAAAADQLYKHIMLANACPPSVLFCLSVITATMPGEPSAWATNIASIFLNPFGVGSSDSSVGANGTRGDMLRVTKRKLLPGFPVNVACKDNRCGFVCAL